jgi:choline dehydrogenase-like flavoprotein
VNTPQHDAAYDAIVVGSGISGGWAAKELTERGLNVLLLERGKNVEHIKDYVNAQKAPWEYPHRGGRTEELIRRYPVLSRGHQLNEKNADWWTSEEESPYTEVKRFDWYRGYHVGGRSLMWGRCSFRWSDFDFEANEKEGLGTNWPIRYADLAPWYGYVERFAGIAGSREGLAQLPDGEFQPAMPLNCAEASIAARLTSSFDGKRRLIPARTANLTQPLPGRSPCQYRNACGLGCPYGAYFSTQSSTLPAAMKTGRLTLRPFAIVTEVLYDRARRRASGVRVLDAVTNQTTDHQAKIIFLCASTLNSTWLLLRSATDVWPGGLGSSSGELGHNLIGAGFKDAAAEPGRWSVGGTAFGEMLPNHENKVTLDTERKDHWGLPVLKIDCATGENERLMRVDMANDMAEMLSACGVSEVTTFDDAYFPGMGIHEMGTARMGTSPKNSVLNKWNQVWDAPNVFVTDGSCMASAACQNPSLTYMALTARAAEHAVAELNRRNL